MFYLNSALENFYNCCKLPICLLDMDCQVLNTYGHDDTTEGIMNKFNVINDLKGKEFEKIEFVLNYGDTISFLFIPSIFNIKKSLSFLIGPFYTTDTTHSYNISILPPISFKYIKHILCHILDDICIRSTNPFINRAIQYIHSHYTKDISIDELCQDFNINKCYFCNLFKKETGYTFIQFLTLLRIEKSKIYLKDPSLTLLDISLNVGFNNQGYYSTIFKKLTGKTPSEYRCDCTKK